MHVRTLFVSLVLIAACGTSEKGGGEKSSSSKKDKAGSTDVASLFSTPKPALPPEVAKAALGAKKDAVLAAVGADSSYLSSKTHADVSYDLDFSKADNLEKVSVTARKTPLEPILTKAWGPPVKTAKGVPFWFDPAAGMRAWLPDYGKGEIVAFSRYESIPTLLGPKGFDLAFAKGKPLFGATMDELKAAWGGMLCDFDREAPRLKEAYEKNAADGLYRIEDARPQLKLCPAWSRTVEQYSPTGDTLHLGLQGKVFMLSMSLQTGGSPELTKQILADLDAKYGTPVERASKSGPTRGYFDPAAKQRVLVTVSEQHVVLWIGPYIPAAELVGDESKLGLAVETPAMIGGTFDAIAKENPETARTHGELMSLVYPPTEWAQSQTQIDLSQFAGETKTYGYITNLPHHDNEAAGDAVFELLKKKYGEPKATKGETPDKTFSFAKGGRKLEARRVNGHWQLPFRK